MGAALSADRWRPLRRGESKRLNGHQGILDLRFLRLGPRESLDSRGLHDSPYAVHDRVRALLVALPGERLGQHGSRERISVGDTEGRPVDPITFFHQRFRRTIDGVPKLLRTIDIQKQAGDSRSRGSIGDGMIDDLLYKALRQEIRLQRESESAAGRHINGTLRKRILYQAQQYELIPLEITGMYREGDSALPEYLRVIDLDVVGNGIRIGQTHFERWPCGFPPHTASIDRRPVCRVVGLDRATDHLSHVPVSAQIRRHRDGHIAPYSFNLLQVPERERIVVAVRDHYRVRLQRIQIVMRPLRGEFVVRARRGSEVCKERNYGDQNDWRGELESGCRRPAQHRFMDRH